MLTESYKKRFHELVGTKKLQPEVIFLIGPPGAGKSTYITKLKNQNPRKDYHVVSTDDILMKRAEPMGLDYNQAFDTIPYEQLYGEFLNDYRGYLKKGHNIIIDRTNMSMEDRKPLLKLIPRGYKRIAVVFQVPTDELQKRLQKRERETGKVIPDDVVQRIMTSYVAPLPREFDKVLTIK